MQSHPPENDVSTQSEDPAGLELSRSRVIRAIYLVAGLLCVGLAVLGAVLPVLPTTPFLLLAAACFARGSRWFYIWITTHRVFGPMIYAWREHRALPHGVKPKALTVIVITFAVSIAVVPKWYVRGILLGIGTALVVFMARMPVLPPGRTSERE